MENQFHIQIEAPQDPTLQEDLERIARDEALPLNEIIGKSFLVTGATGLVGSLMVKTLCCISRVRNASLTIYAVIRNEEKARTIYGDLLDRGEIRLIRGDITGGDFVESAGEQIRESIRNLPSGGFPHLDYIIHGAAVTTSKTMVEKPVETIMTAIDGTKNLLDLGVAAGVRSFVYLSSMEVYGDMSVYRCIGAAPGQDRADAAVTAGACTSTGRPAPGKLEWKCGTVPEKCESVSGKYGTVPEKCEAAAGGTENESWKRADETRLGFVDPQKVRSNYPESKRMCENLCTAYHAEYGLSVKIARLAQTFGAGILPWERRVFAQFAQSALDETDIVLHTKGLSEGNYCYSRDVMRGLLTILLKGADGEAYNVANEETHTTIAGMANMVADRIADGKIRVVFDIPEANTFGYAADTKLQLDASKLRALGWTPEVSLEEAYRRTMASMRCRHHTS